PAATIRASIAGSSCVHLPGDARTPAPSLKQQDGCCTGNPLLRRRRRAAVEATELGTAGRAPHPALGARGGRLAPSRADRVARGDGAGPARLLRRRRLREERRQQRVDAVEDRRHDAADVVEHAAQLLARLLAAGATPLASHVARELAGVRLEMLREAA